MQKTFQQDVINRKVIKNTGQLPMYLIENHHEGIVSREKYDAVQAEMARRKAAKSPSKDVYKRQVRRQRCGAAGAAAGPKPIGHL